jgi:hypothetical protein
METPLPTTTASDSTVDHTAFQKRIPNARAYFAIFLAFWGVYLASGCYQRSAFNPHVYLALSILHGRFDVIDPPGYFELVRTAGHSYVAYGIGPSLLMLPFVAIWGLDFNQSIFVAGLGALAVTLWRSVLERLGTIGSTRDLLTVLFGLGSLFWFYAGENGSTWNLMHVTAVLGLVLAIHETLGRARGWFVGVSFGVAVLSRQPVLLSLPFFVGSLWRTDSNGIRGNLNREIWFGLCLGGLMFFDAFYNSARFGNVFDNGYRRVIEATTATRFRPWGLFSFRYVADNAKVYFLRLPENLSDFPWYNPTMAGFSILISTPALLLAAAADYRKRLNLLALAVCITIQGFYLTYFWTGYEQFGCRYTVDYLPFVNLLAASGAKYRSRRSILSITLAGMLVELWGIGWWRTMGW